MDNGPTGLDRRQILANPSPTTSALPHSCSPHRLPSGGVLSLGGSNIITLGFDVVFQPHCEHATITTPLDPLATDTDLSVLDRQAPFYTSTSPLIYAISSATIISYMLVIILFVTPRTFHIGGVGGGVSLLGRKGTVGGSYGSNTVIGIGSRPWLQKIAASTLAISMTIVTADAFKYAEKQYDAGYEDAKELTWHIVDGLEIKTVRLISESFLWLAQAQTLIRLFQRHREKLVIKWTAFVLITLEVIFTILFFFVYEDDPHQPKAFTNSIPALNYLFALSLNICYAAFVIVYTLRKRRFAFFHPQMQSMPLMALLSLTAVTIPVVFFILDLSKPDVSGWGSYVRWVGACAASVVVWEWVERIEALEREEKKDGILGREVFDGDEMLGSDERRQDWPGSPDGKKSGGTFTGLFGNSIGARLKGLEFIVQQRQKHKAVRSIPLKPLESESGQSSGPNSMIVGVHHNNIIPTNQRSGPPVATLSPVSRAGSTSDASTVYAVRYHPTTESTPPIPETGLPEDGAYSQHAQNDRLTNKTPTKILAYPSRLSRIPLPFRRQRQTPPAEVAAALAEQQIQPLSPGPAPTPTILDRLHLRRHPHPVPMPKGVIFVPAPPRRRPSMSESIHNQHVRTFSADSDRDSEGGDDRPPAVVRNALRRSTPATPAYDHDQFVSSDQGQTQYPEASAPALEEAVEMPWAEHIQPSAPLPEHLPNSVQAQCAQPSASPIDDSTYSNQARPLEPSAPSADILADQSLAPNPEPVAPSAETVIENGIPQSSGVDDEQTQCTNHDR